MKNVKIIFSLVLLLIVGCFGFWLANKFTPRTPDTTAVVKEIRALNRWETSSYTIEKIIDAGTSGNVFQQFLFGNKILLIAHGEIIGGFDLSQFSEKDLVINGSSIAITLTTPEILVAQIDNSKTKVYDRQEGLLVSPTNNLESDALAKAQSDIKNAACKEGILTTTAENAKTQLTSLFSSLGFKQITINIPQGHC